MAQGKKVKIPFQSLFSWKSPSDADREGDLMVVEKRFNPCFHGSRPRTEVVYLDFILGGEFQSLFSWKSPSDKRTCSEPSQIFRVSILVFMEVALGPRAFHRLNKADRCFNPCFHGSRPRTVDDGEALICREAFQSLFSWKSPSDSGLFSFFFLLLTVKPAFSRPLLSTTRTYWKAYKFIPPGGIENSLNAGKCIYLHHFRLADIYGLS